MVHYLKKDRLYMKAAATVAALGMVVVTTPATAVQGTRYTACEACAPKDLAWGEGEFDQVYLVGAPSGVRNQHPQTIAPETLARALLTVQVKAAQGTQRLLDEDAAAALALGLSKALTKASAQQDAVFMVTSRPGGGMFGPRLGNSGRAFIDARGLNLILGEAHVEFVAPYRATRMERPFAFGSRGAPSKVTLASEQLSQMRNDWILVPLSGGSAGPAPAVATVRHPAAEAQAAPAQVPSAAPALRDEQYYLAQEARLKGLKRLREQDLISEQEYQAKRSEILKAW